MAVTRSSTLACFALLIVAPVALGAACDRGEDDVVQALAAEAPEEDDNSSCSFRQLRGEILPAAAAQPDILDAEGAGAEAAAGRRDAGAEVEDTMDASLLDKADWVPMIKYPTSYCKKCGEMAFCHRAGNPGCGGYATGGITSFYNHKHGKGCGGVSPVLTIPRTYVKNIDELKTFNGANSLLSGMLVSGFNTYIMSGGKPPFWQCIHKSRMVSVRWLHLHTFCKAGHVDNLPNRAALCAVMYSTSQAGSVAAQLLYGGGKR